MIELLLGHIQKHPAQFNFIMTYKERGIDSDHFGATKLASFDPSGDELLSLGEDDHLLNFFFTESLSVTSIHDLSIIGTKNINFFCFLDQSSTLLIAAENEVFSYQWPNGTIKSIYQHQNEITLICATSNEKHFCICDDKNDIFIFELCGNKDCELIQKIFSSSSHKVAWIGFGPLCDTFALVTEEPAIFEIECNDFEVIFSEKAETNEVCIPCFTRQSDFVFRQKDFIVALSQIHHNIAVFKLDKDNANIAYIAASKYTDHIAIFDSMGTITISPFDHSLYKFETEPDFDSPQVLQSLVSINYASSRITSLSWGFGSLVAGDEDGGLRLFERLVQCEKPPETNEAHIEKPKNIRALTLIEQLNTVDPSRIHRKSEESTTHTTKKTPSKQTKKTKKNPKSTSKNSKLTISQFKKTEKISDDDDNSEMSDFIESKEEFEERIKNLAPEPEPKAPESEISEEPESESSSDHEIDFEQYLTEEQKAKLQSRRQEEEEQNEPVDDNPIDLEPFSDAEESDDDLNDIDGFEFDNTFMPSNNEHFVGNRRYMCYNDYAAILLRHDKEDETKTEIDIHRSSDGQIRSIMNPYKFRMATIDEYGMVLASDSDLLYEHHESWAPDKTTMLTFDKDKILLVASGNGWFAVATNAPSIVLYTSAGLELGIINLPLTCITMTGRGKFLFYVTSDGNDILANVVSVVKNKILIENQIISAFRPIKWVGFDNQNRIFLQDKRNIVYMLSKDFSWKWIPVLDLTQHFDTITTNYYMVKIEDNQVFGIPLRSQRSPLTYPIPRPHRLDMDIMTRDPEVRPWLSNVIQPQSKIQRGDAELVKMYASAIASDHEYRAYDIAQELKTKKTRKFAVGYADNNGASIVSDKLTGVDRKRQRKVVILGGIAPENHGKRKLPTRSSSEDAVVYVRKSKHAQIRPQANLEEIQKPENNDNTEEEEEDEMENTAVSNSLFEALKSLGSKTTQQASSRNESITDIRPKPKSKKRLEPIVKKKTTRKKKADEPSSFMPLFQ